MTNLIETKICALEKERDETIKNKIPKRYADVNSEECNLTVGESYYVYGSIGVGKTRLSYSLLKKIIEDRFSDIAKEIRSSPNPERYSYGIYPSAVVYNFPEVLQRLRATIDEKDDLTYEDIAKENRILVLDDIGAEKFTDWSIETLYKIVNYRYENILPTIFISNLNLKELADKVGDRIASRIAEMCKIMKVHGKDKRLE